MFVTFITISSFSDRYSNLTTIEILVLLSWIPASKEFWNIICKKSMPIMKFETTLRILFCYHLFSSKISKYRPMLNYNHRTVRIIRNWKLETQSLATLALFATTIETSSLATYYSSTVHIYLKFSTRSVDGRSS